MAFSLIHFKPQKGTAPSTCQISTHSCKRFMTDLFWPNFTWIFLHNSVNPHWIPTKIGTKMHFNKPLLDWYTCSCFIASVQNEEEETKVKFCFICISGLARAVCWYVNLLTWCSKRFWSYIGVKMTFSFFLSIYGTSASWAAWHTTVCLDMWPLRRLLW